MSINHKVKVAYCTAIKSESDPNQVIWSDCIRTFIKKNKDLTIENVEDGDADLLNISCSAFCDDLPSIVSRYGSPIMVTVGGAYPTNYPERVLEDLPTAIVVIGEGERTTLNLLGLVEAAIVGGRELDRNELRDIPNIAYVHEGEVVITRREISDLPLQNIPTIYTEHVDETTMLRVESSRGCDYGCCSFCAVPRKYNGVRRRDYPIDRTIFEIRSLASFGRVIAFTDEEFIGLDTRHAWDLVNRIIEEKKNGTIPYNTRFVASVSVFMLARNDWDGGMNDELLRRMRKAGFDRLFVGIESGSATQLRRYGKGVTPEENETVLKVFKNIGIEPDIGFIMFDPLMSIEELRENILFISRNGLDRGESRLSKRMILIPGTRYAYDYERLTGRKAPDMPRECTAEEFLDPSVRRIIEIIGTEDQWVNVLQHSVRMTGGAGARTLRDIRMSEFQALVRAYEEVTGEELDLRGDSNGNHHDQSKRESGDVHRSDEHRDCRRQGEGRLPPPVQNPGERPSDPLRQGL